MGDQIAGEDTPPDAPMGSRKRHHRLDPNRTVFEFRDLAKGVECRIGELIGRRFHKSEGNEHGTLRRAIVLTQHQLHRATT